ncbi:hypothetical protein Ddc_20112 [Ditylenchus destructor]|nr:hypothetical protein Ddc_20112 [Ditylenchus destructor]
MWQRFGGSFPILGLATPSATTERALEQARKAAMASALAAQKQQQPHLLDSPIPDEPRLPEPMRFTVNRAASDARPASTVELSSPEPDLIDWRDLQEDLDSVAQELSASAPAGMRGRAKRAGTGFERRGRSAEQRAGAGVAPVRCVVPGASRRWHRLLPSHRSWPARWARRCSGPFSVWRDVKSRLG